MMQLLHHRAAVLLMKLQPLLRCQSLCTRRGIMAIHREAPYRDAKWPVRLPQTELITDTTIILPLFCDFTELALDHGLFLWIAR